MITIQAESNVPTDYGVYKIIAFSESDRNWMPHIVLIAKGTDFSKTVNVRIHSECITGEVFHSQKCECGQQLDAAMEFMQKNGGVIVYLRQEGRNIGLINKLKAYALQEKGLDTVSANLELGLPADDRDFGIAIDILKILGIKSVNLMTNNPEKIKIIEKSSEIEFNKRIPLIVESNKNSKEYLDTKKKIFGHLLGREKN
ncbi:MAG: GTP cyclohydrolase II [Bergeyella sp.]|nr:GTP cyclohydrolase II [Bergeyella sp.]